MTLAQLAEKTDSHVGNLSRIERDAARPSLELLFRIAKALDTHLSEVFSLSDEAHYPDASQLALNTVFSSLEAKDRELLLDFAQLLKQRAARQ